MLATCSCSTVLMAVPSSRWTCLATRHARNASGRGDGTATYELLRATGQPRRRDAEAHARDPVARPGAQQPQGRLGKCSRRRLGKMYESGATESKSGRHQMIL